MFVNREIYLRINEIYLEIHGKRIMVQDMVQENNCI